jgi:hypothetical protein
LLRLIANLENENHSKSGTLKQQKNNQSKRTPKMMAHLASTGENSRVCYSELELDVGTDSIECTIYTLEYTVIHTQQSRKSDLDAQCMVD